MIKKISMLLCSLLILGCAARSTVVGRKIDPQRVAKIQKGVTTRQEVVNLLGSPDQLQRASNGEVTMTWMYTEAKYKNPLSRKGVESRTQTVIVVCGPDEIVKDVIENLGSTEGDAMKTEPGSSFEDVEKNKRSR